ncbi:MAG: hypothetical protein ACXADF_18250 [Candidatus Thorarchaeota archaeon]|jgi:hypothetical protein
MQSAIISIEQVYLEAFTLCFYLMGLEGLDWKYIYNLPWRAVLFLAQVNSVFLMIHAGIGITLLALSGTSYLSLGWVGLWLALLWINRIRIKGIIRGERTDQE